MQRSTTQVLFRYLPDAVFQHEDGFFARVDHIGGPRVSDLNRKVLLDELAQELAQWLPEQIGIPDPRTNPDEFVTLEPEEVSWDFYPLTFECTNSSCGRVRRWFQQAQLLQETNANGRLRCKTCGSKMRQLRYLTAHNCGVMDPLHTPRCPGCQRTEDMHLEDLGSFRSSSWRCHACGAAVGTRFTPCNCGQYSRGGGQVYRQGYTARDQRLWYPQTLTILNISGQTYDNLQRHHQRGIAALASWLGDETTLAVSLADLDRPSTGTRMTQKGWDVQERKMRELGLEESIIEELRRTKGPATTGTAAVSVLASPEVIEMSASRPMVERAGLYDTHIIEDRKSFDEVRAGATGPLLTAANASKRAMDALGIEDISVTQRFPIVIASYGYTRSRREPGAAHLRSYARQHHYQRKTPIFAVPANTEALLVTFDARSLLGFLRDEGDIAGTLPSNARAAKLTLAGVLAAEPAVGGDDPAGKVRRLVHSASHALLRALDDGQSGFGESSLAEWIVPNALTAGIYVGSYNDFTLGALDTVLRRRIAPWLTRAAHDVNHCDNDPMCGQTSSHRPHAACDRCVHLSFGCRTWNADLDRKLLRRFWLWTQQRATRP
ncbi:MAG: hypothetical protein ACRD07_04560 [Acidimicrobiales bacterium]